ncbi:hypothetical protein F4679DRAFT_594581 [Xylaria curta]|nr:hypothetical protein F4679DRAFT_594581 [Xylaria curta]
MSSGRSGRGGRGGRQQPEWRQKPNGYWEQVPGDGTDFYQRADGTMRRVPRIRDTTSSLDQDESALLLQYLLTTDFINYRGERVEFTIAHVQTELHESTSNVDPHRDAGPHVGVQLTNDALWSDEGRSHMLHFRPGAVRYSFFYNKSQTRKQTAKGQDKRNEARQQKKDRGGKRGGPGGGAGAAGSSSRGGKSGSSQQYSGYGGGSSNSGQYYQQGGYGYSHRTYSVLPQLFSLFLLQVWRGMVIGHPGVPIQSERITNGFLHSEAGVKADVAFCV